MFWKAHQVCCEVSTYRRLLAEMSEQDCWAVKPRKWTNRCWTFCIAFLGSYCFMLSVASWLSLPFAFPGLSSHCSLLSFSPRRCWCLVSLSLLLKFRQGRILSKGTVALVFKEHRGEKWCPSPPPSCLLHIGQHAACTSPLDAPVPVPVVLWVIYVSTWMTSATSNSFFLLLLFCSLSGGEGARRSWTNVKLPLSPFPSVLVAFSLGVLWFCAPWGGSSGAVWWGFAKSLVLLRLLLIQSLQVDHIRCFSAKVTWKKGVLLDWRT